MRDGVLDDVLVEVADEFKVSVEVGVRRDDWQWWLDWWGLSGLHGSKDLCA